MSYLELAKKVQTLIQPEEEEGEGSQKDPKEFVDQYVDEKLDFKELGNDTTRYSSFRKY